MFLGAKKCGGDHHIIIDKNKDGAQKCAQNF